MTVSSVTRCRSNSFYVAPGLRFYFSERTLVIIGKDGDLLEVTHRDDIRRWEMANPGWDGRVLVGPPGGLDAVRARLASDPETIEVWRIDSRVIEGRRPRDAASFAMHQCVMKGIGAAGGVASLTQTLAPTAPRSVRRALTSTIERGGWHAAHVVTAAWRAGLLHDPNIAVRLLSGPALPFRIVPDSSLEPLLANLAQSGLHVDAESLLTHMIGIGMLDPGAQSLLAGDPNTPPDVLRMLMNETTGRYGTKLAAHPNAPKDVLDRGLDDRDWIVRRSAAGNLNATADQTERALSDTRVEVRIAAAGNPNATPGQIERAMSDPDFNVRGAAIGNPSATPEQIERALFGTDLLMSSYAASNPSATPEQIGRALTSDNSRVRASAAGNPNATNGQLDVALSDMDWSVRSSAAANLKCAPEQLARALQDPSADVRQAAASNPNTRIMDLEAAARAGEESARIAIARSPDATTAHLDRALSDPHPAIRRAAAGNVNATAEQIFRALSDPEVTVRRAAAKNLNAPAAVLATELETSEERNDWDVYDAVLRNPNTPTTMFETSGHQDVLQYRKVLANQPIELDTTSDLAYHTLVAAGALAADLPATVTRVDELGSLGVPFRFPSDSLHLRHAMNNAKINVNGQMLVPRVISSGRELRDNANYIGYCTGGYETEIREDRALIIALDHSGAEGRRDTAYNVEVRWDGNGQWTMIDEINSRFNEGLTDSARDEITEQIRHLLRMTP